MSKINLVCITVNAVFGETPLFVPHVYRGAEAVDGTLHFLHESGRPLRIQEAVLMQPTTYTVAHRPADGIGIFGIIWAHSNAQDAAKAVLADALIKTTNEALSKIGTTLTALKPVEHVSKLWEDRHEEADGEFASFTFPAEVGESSGWEYAVPGNEMTKVVYLESPTGKDSIAAKFVVTFEEGKADVLTVDGYINGEPIEHKLTNPTM